MTKTYGSRVKEEKRGTNVKSLEYLVKANCRIPSELVLLNLSWITFTTMLSFLLFSMVWSFDTSWRCQIIRCLERYSGFKLCPPTSEHKVCDLHAGGVRLQHFL